MNICWWTFIDELFENDSAYSPRMLNPGLDEPFSTSSQLSTYNELGSASLPVLILAQLDSAYAEILLGSTLHVYVSLCFHQESFEHWLLILEVKVTFKNFSHSVSKCGKNERSYFLVPSKQFVITLAFHEQSSLSGVCRPKLHLSLPAVYLQGLDSFLSHPKHL